MSASAAAPKSITILGSTGTIGQNTLKCLAEHPERFNLHSLVAGGNVALLASQARQFRPKRAVIANQALYGELQNLLHGTGIETAAGEAAILEAASEKVDLVMSAIVGVAGLKPTLAAIRTGTTIAMANKECLVCAGELMQREVAQHGATLIPVDSEHSGIFQLLNPARMSQVERVTITASGGPFRQYTREQMRDVTPEQAVRHPNWNMGAKISVDSATLMNKGLELIEAYRLFPLKAEQLHVLVHPQSIVHALVEMVDGSTLAQLSQPDMCTPIAYALAWPERMAAPVQKLQLEMIGTLSFEAPDTTRFPALALARAALTAGADAPATLNAANEVAVARFLQGEIGFLDIADIVEHTLEKRPNHSLESLEAVLACDQAARALAQHYQPKTTVTMRLS